MDRRTGGRYRRLLRGNHGKHSASRMTREAKAPSVRRISAEQRARMRTGVALEISLKRMDSWRHRHISQRDDADFALHAILQVQRTYSGEILSPIRELRGVFSSLNTFSQNFAT